MEYIFIGIIIVIITLVGVILWKSQKNKKPNEANIFLKQDLKLNNSTFPI